MADGDARVVESVKELVYLGERHNLIIGTPGSGKTTLGRAIGKARGSSRRRLLFDFAEGSAAERSERYESLLAAVGSWKSGWWGQPTIVVSNLEAATEWPDQCCALLEGIACGVHGEIWVTLVLGMAESAATLQERCPTFWSRAAKIVTHCGCGPLQEEVERAVGLEPGSTAALARTREAFSCLIAPAPDRSRGWWPDGGSPYSLTFAQIGRAHV